MPGRSGPTGVVWALVAVGLAGAAQVEVWAPQLAPGVSGTEGNRAVLAVTGLLTTLPLAFLRRHPLVVVTVTVGAAAVEQLLTVPTEGLSSLIALMLASYGSAAFSSRIRAYAALVVIVVGGTVIGEEDAAFVLILLLASWGGGVLVARRGHDIDTLRADNLTLQRTQEQAAAQGAEPSGSGSHASSTTSSPIASP